MFVVAWSVRCASLSICRASLPTITGSNLIALAIGFSEEWALHCSCGRSSRCRSTDFKICAVSHQAYDRGYGLPDEMVQNRRNEQVAD
jgi:hypothetical protein